MKSLRFYFLMSLVGLLASLTLVSCSDKEKTTGGQQCVGWQCGGWDPNNPGMGNPGMPGYGAYSPNGTQQNGSQFRDFTRLINGSYYRFYGYGENQLQISLMNAMSSSPTIVFKSPQLQAQTAMLTGYKFTDHQTGQVGFEVYHSFNGGFYKVGELLLVTGTLETSTSIPYRFKYLRNSGTGTVIMNGTLRKGFDF